MVRKKSINQLFLQLERFKNTNYFMMAYFAYFKAFEQHFKCRPHTKECKKFIETYGKDYKC